MSALFRIVISFVVSGLGLASSLLAAQTVTPDPESPLIQTARIAGDQYSKFNVSCLIVYPDGRYHRERRTQIAAGMARNTWEPPKVFESQLQAEDIVRLRAIIENPDFVSIKGTIGSVRKLNPMLDFTLAGVAPNDDVEIRTISVAHARQPQVFEITETHLAERQEPLREFLKWIKDTESHQTTRLPRSMANNCASLSVANNAPSVATQFPTGLTLPSLISAVAPQLPPNTPKPRSIVVEFVVNPDGTAGNAVIKDHVSANVADSVIEAITKWTFHPARLLSVPVAFKLETEIKF